MFVESVNNRGFLGLTRPLSRTGALRMPAVLRGRGGQRAGMVQPMQTIWRFAGMNI
jgi:hypothetical protein